MWIMFNFILVMFMQPGFAFLEVGAVRRNNVKAIMTKNFMDLGGTLFCWTAFSSSIAFGDSLGGVVGSTWWQGTAIKNPADFLFQFAFAASASTIISGCVAERMTLDMFLFYSTWFSGFIYPFVAHWIWNVGGFLAKLGFVDFAGTAVVHVVGGCTGMVASKMLGPRVGRFVGESRVRQIAPFSATFQALGVWLLLLGWLGFNGGSTKTLHGDEARRAGRVVLNTLLSAFVSAFVCFIYHRFRLKMYDLMVFMNGILVGCVAITAGAGHVSPGSAAAIGAVAAVCFLGSQALFEQRLQIDDPVDAITTHFCVGLWGILAVGLFHEKLGAFNGGGGKLFGVQLLGLIIVIVFTAVIAFLGFKIGDKLLKGARVSKAVEMAGMDCLLLEGSLQDLEEPRENGNDKGPSPTELKNLSDILARTREFAQQDADGGNSAVLQATAELQAVLAQLTDKPFANENCRVNLRELIEKTAAEFQAKCHVPVQYEFDDNIPALVLVNPKAFNTVLDLGLQQAFKFSETSTIAILLTDDPDPSRPCNVLLEVVDYCHRYMEDVSFHPVARPKSALCARLEKLVTALGGVCGVVPGTMTNKLWVSIPVNEAAARISFPISTPPLERPLWGEDCGSERAYSRRPSLTTAGVPRITPSSVTPEPKLRLPKPRRTRPKGKPSRPSSQPGTGSPSTRSDSPHAACPAPPPDSDSDRDLPSSRENSPAAPPRARAGGAHSTSTSPRHLHNPLSPASYHVSGERSVPAFVRDAPPTELKAPRGATDLQATRATEQATRATDLQATRAKEQASRATEDAAQLEHGAEEGRQGEEKSSDRGKSPSGGMKHRPPYPLPAALIVDDSDDRFGTVESMPTEETLLANGELAVQVPAKPKPEEIRIIVKRLDNNSIHTVMCHLEMSLADFKEAVCTATGVPSSEQRLLLRGAGIIATPAKPATLPLQDFGLRKHDTVILIVDRSLLAVPEVVPVADLVALALSPKVPQSPATTLRRGEDMESPCLTPLSMMLSFDPVRSAALGKIQQELSSKLPRALVQGATPVARDYSAPPH
eukprot:CAMPEP_0114566104 /NCGR_PEP_ID=MMETSP0114-20121206/14700_1 /TAXON_ID=31324 /ORGANISM="Goniomonas sp, Strain m" /LENGTH=1048 /DNA_ID=CAMNT_0001752465 /DNA_START=8 /DNA_END=3154 /DNA_ORIENTATION=+